MAQKIELNIDVEALKKMIIEDLIKKEETMNEIEYELTFEGDDSTNLCVTIATEICISGHKGKLKESVNFNVVKKLLYEKFNDVLGNITAIYPVFERENNKSRLSYYRISIDSKEYGKTFVNDKYMRYM